MHFEPTGAVLIPVVCSSERLEQQYANPWWFQTCLSSLITNEHTVQLELQTPRFASTMPRRKILLRCRGQADGRRRRRMHCGRRVALVHLWLPIVCTYGRECSWLTCYQAFLWPSHPALHQQDHSSRYFKSSVILRMSSSQHVL